MFAEGSSAVIRQNDSPAQILEATTTRRFIEGSESQKTLLALPNEIQTEIFRHAGLFDRCALALTCKHLADVATTGGLLKFRKGHKSKARFVCHVGGLRPELTKPSRWFHLEYCSAAYCSIAVPPDWFRRQYLFHVSGDASAPGVVVIADRRHLCGL